MTTPRQEVLLHACMHAGHHWRKLAPVQILALVAEYREREDEQVCAGPFPVFCSAHDSSKGVSADEAHGQQMCCCWEF